MLPVSAFGRAGFTSPAAENGADGQLSTSCPLGCFAEECHYTRRPKSSRVPWVVEDECEGGGGEVRSGGQTGSLGGHGCPGHDPFLALLKFCLTLYFSGYLPGKNLDIDPSESRGQK